MVVRSWRSDRLRTPTCWATKLSRMENVTPDSDLPADKWASFVPELKLPQLDHLERDGVTIQCISSSDFVVGKQTNFNGPVTIISCTEVLKQGRHNPCKEGKEVIIEDKVLSPSAAMRVQKLAVEKEKPDEEEHPAGQDKAGRLKNLKKYSSIVLAVLGLVAVVTTAVLVSFTPEGSALKCSSLPGGVCIYSGFSWGGRPKSDETNPLETPVPYVVLSETHQDFCYDVTECLAMVEIFQSNATEVACNFLLGGDGNAYEDRGWRWENSLGGPAAGKSLQLCFLGEFSCEIATYPQFVLAKTLIQFAVDNNYVSKDYVLMATNATCPDDVLGSSVYKVVKKWTRFSENPFS